MHSNYPDDWDWSRFDEVHGSPTCWHCGCEDVDSGSPGWDDGRPICPDCWVPIEQDERWAEEEAQAEEDK